MAKASVILTVRISPELALQVEAICKANNESKNSLVTRLLEAELSN